MGIYSFPVRMVAHFNSERQVWQGQRGKGVAIAHGVYQALPGNTNHWQVVFASAVAPEIVQFAERVSASLQLLQQRLPSADADLLSQIVGWPVQFLSGHASLLTLATQPYVLQVAAELAQICPAQTDHDTDVRQGLTLLLALAQYQLLLIAQGASERQALFKVLALYAGFNSAEQASLQQVLADNRLDSGNLFADFLRRANTAADIDYAGQDQTIWQDLQLSWLLGQDRVDLPYPRAAAVSVLHSELDPDQQRLALFELLRQYDRSIEQQNISRIATEVAAARQQLIFGRMSRAFHNQATLFANAVLLQPQPAWQTLAAELMTISAAKQSLQASAQILVQMLYSKTEIALTHLEGACERFEQAVLDEQQQALAVALQPARDSIENHNDVFNPVQETAPPFAELMQQASVGLALVAKIRQQLLMATKRHAAYVVISQRPSPTGSHLLVKINEFAQPYAGKAANLRKLVRLAGERIYSSPDYGWLAYADHWIEAIPLFIKEEVLVQEGQETTRTVIDISGMEVSFREEMADLWAKNIQHVLESELICIARYFLHGTQQAELSECALLAACATDDTDAIAAITVLLAECYRQDVAVLQKQIEAQDSLPFAVLKQVLLNHPLLLAVTDHYQMHANWLDAVQKVLPAKQLSMEVLRYRQRALQARRSLPALHVLTTQSAGMTEGYIRTWLEESMALYNVIADKNLQEQVSARENFHACRIHSLAAQSIRALGLWIEVTEMGIAENLTEATAVLRILNRNKLVQEDVACLGTLLEFVEMQHGRGAADAVTQPPLVAAYLQNHAATVQTAALQQVVARNRASLADQLTQSENDEAALLAVVMADEDCRQDLAYFTQTTSRQQVLLELATEHPHLQLINACETYLRRYQQLRKTTARKEIIAELGLQALTLHPYYYVKASGGGKRYHLLYTPSRVDLGHRERESVESWAQWIGGADRAAAQAGRQIYSLINKDVRFFNSLTEPEILKTGENASMAAHFAFSNALSLMVSAAAHGDFEAMADLMNRRHDRLIHPAGEGYGGYCVPKDGLFLEFVLTLNRRDKLQQIGLPGCYHAEVIALANKLLDKQADFSSQLDWEAWAAEQLHGQAALTPYFQLQGGVPVFQLSRIALVLDKLGKPEIRDHYRIATSLAAGWGLHKMVTGGEQVNRFMPFFKAWLIRQGVQEAAGYLPTATIRLANAIVVLTAEYKPDTQDARFATGLRKFEILTGAGEHLLHALDSEGQLLALLLHGGFAAVEQRGWCERLLALMHIDAADTGQLAQLRGLFPGGLPPAEIRLVSPMGLSVQDLLNYTSDAQLETLANNSRQQLLAFGLSAKEINAYLRSWGARLACWAIYPELLAQLTAAQLQALTAGMHALLLAELGPERHYEYAVQGADVLDTGIPHHSLLALLADPAKLCRLMLTGNPHSALVIVDGAAGARQRAMQRDEVMLWFAAAEQQGRQAVYLSVGVGRETVTAWRLDMQRLRHRAEQWWQAIKVFDNTAIQEHYAVIVQQLHQDQEVLTALADMEKLARFGRDNPRRRLQAAALNRLGCGVLVTDLQFTDFLAIGGLYQFIGASPAEINAAIATFNAAITGLGGQGSAIAETTLTSWLGEAEIQAVAEFQQEKGVESSNKATEERSIVALDARRQLAGRLAKATAQQAQQAGFAKVTEQDSDFPHQYLLAMRSLGSWDKPVTAESYGEFLAHARNAMLALSQELPGLANLADRNTLLSRFVQLFQANGLDEALQQQVAGGYEDIGDFGRLAQHIRMAAVQEDIDNQAKHLGLAFLAQAAELLTIALAIETTREFFLAGQTGQPSQIWRGLAGFFAKTINDHSYEYRPWLYSRGTGFADYHGEALYELAVERHQWLYGYLRYLLTQYTELNQLPVAEQDLLLGNFLGKAQVTAIGAEADGEAERIWRGYGQLRELAFIRNDGLPLPVVFASFAPDLIAADQRINHVIAAPVGRTHFSRVLCEGPTLHQQLLDSKQPGANIIISRHLTICQQARFKQLVVTISSGHCYLDQATFIAALQQEKAYNAVEAANLASRYAHPKGIRIAARFSQPVVAALVYPFHGNPLYVDGTLEAVGLPYTVQSLFHTWTTYDKSKYADIFTGSGVALPAEIAWQPRFTAQSHDQAQVMDWILHGLPDSNYPGLLNFIKTYPLVMIKDAAESGGRNAQVFALVQRNGQPDADQISAASAFIYQISLRHPVCIQEVIISSPEHWATEDFLQQFVARQIAEWGSHVNRQRYPHTSIYGSHRLILSTANPAETDLRKKWHISHWISLNSKQLITNLGRGGTLEQMLPEYIQSAHRHTILDKLAHAGRLVMEAIASYEAKAAAAYTAETGRTVGKDLLGVSYGVPRYLMLDFLIAPVFDQAGVWVSCEAELDANGQRVASRFILQQGETQVTAKIIDWRVVLIEPNIGVGLWDRVALREEYHARQQAEQHGLGLDWTQVGANARVVLADLNSAGAAYLQKLKAADGIS